MPLATITSFEGKRTADEKQTIGKSIYEALVHNGVLEGDRFQRFLELKPENFIVDPLFPTLSTPRSDDFLLIEILWSVGRSPKAKKAVLQEIIEGIQQRTGIDPNDVMIVFIETPWESWAFHAGVQFYNA